MKFKPFRNPNRDFKLEVLTKGLDTTDVMFKVDRVAEDSESKKVYARVVPYIATSACIRIMTEAFGLAWSDEYFRERNALYCRIKVDLGNGRYVIRENCTEPDGSFKAEASDAFKRCCFKFGIGICLRNLPQVWLLLREGEYCKNSDGKIKANGKLKLAQMNWDIDWEKRSVVCRDGEGVRFDSDKSLSDGD